MAYQKLFAMTDDDRRQTTLLSNTHGCELIISWTSTDMDVENSSGNEPDTSVPVIISADMLEKEKNRLHHEVNKQVERNKEKEVGKENVHKGK